MSSRFLWGDRIEIESESVKPNKSCEKCQFNIRLLHNNIHVMSTPVLRARNIIDSFENSFSKTRAAPPSKRGEAKV